MSDSVPEWYAKYVDDMDQETLFSTVLAANFMNINPLLELGCAKIGSKIRGIRTPQEIAKVFGIENRKYKEPDEEAIKKAYPWCIQE